MIENADAKVKANALADAQRIMLYAGVGPELVQYDVDVDSAELTRRRSLILPGNIQYAWPHASQKYFYAASSNKAAQKHHISAFCVDPVNGELSRHGSPVSLPQRPINITTDIPSEHVLAAYGEPSGLTVHRINRDGTLGDAVRQTASLDTGFFPHQIRVAPNNATAILVTRGPRKPVGSGALKLFKYHDGVLGDGVSITPAGAEIFGPRHLDFHPVQPWFYVLLERQHKICAFSLDQFPMNRNPLFVRETLAGPEVVRSRQGAGAIHVHPNGSVVYASERANGTIEIDGEQVFAGGENTILAYSIDQLTGEPSLMQCVETRGLHPRTFAMDKGGRILVAANICPVRVKEGNNMRIIPASLDVFRMDASGRLEFARNYVVDVGEKMMFWMGMMTLKIPSSAR